MVRHSLFWRFSLAIAGLVMAAAVALAIGALLGVRAVHVDVLSDALHRQAELVLSAGDPFAQPPALVQERLVAAGRASGSRITIIREDGGVIADSDADPTTMDDHGQRPEVIAARAKGWGHSLRMSSTVQRELLYAARRVDGPQGPIGYVRVAMPASTVHDLLAPVLARTVWMALAVAAVAVAVGVFAVRRLTAPLRRLAHQAGTLAEGGAHAEVAPGADGESTAIAVGFNALVDQLRARVAELDRARIAAESADRAKSEFMHAVSHELRTPLTAVLGFAAMLAEGRGGPLTEKQARWVDHVAAGGRQLLALVDDVVDLARLEAGAVRADTVAVDTAIAVADGLAAVRDQASAKGILLSADLPTTLPTARADQRLVGRVLRDLLDNALKFTPAGGTVAISARQVADRIEIAVRDTGIGFDPADGERLFTAFTQLSGDLARTHSGLGLGLTLARRLTEIQGGSIRAESAGPGHGSTFTIVLPACAPAPAETR